MRHLWLVAALSACTANDDIPDPQLGSVVPDHGSPGSVVMIAGDYFCQRPETGQDDPTCDQTGSVDFDTVPGIATTWTDTAIMVEVPSGKTGSVDLSVSAAGRISNSITFTVD